MVVISLAAAAGSRAVKRARAGRCSENDHDQTRREDFKPKLAMSRTEPSRVLPIPGGVAHASVMLRCSSAERSVAISPSRPIPAGVGPGLAGSPPDDGAGPSTLRDELPRLGSVE